MTKEKISYSEAVAEIKSILQKIEEGSLAHRAYGETLVHERHRHRFEFNDRFREALESVGVRFSGICPENGLAEILEFRDHPWFLAVQFHPELKSKPFDPHPLFRSFVGAALAQSRLV